jgi:hypothetical protein
VDGTGREDQKRDEEYDENNPWASPVHAAGGGELTAILLSLKDVEKIKEAAYRAGREDLLRSGSCPECTAGDPHNEPDVPHIHLTPYGYLLYAADHERPGFIEEIRAVERRAGREDAARAGYAEAVARLRDDDRYRNWWSAHPDQQFGTAYWAPDGRQHLAAYLETVGPDGPDVTHTGTSGG